MIVYHDKIQEGCFVFQVIRTEPVYIQPAPLLEEDDDEDDLDEDDDHFTTNELVAVDRIQPCSDHTTFVRLADQSGWLVAECRGILVLRSLPVTLALTVLYADCAQTVRRHPTVLDDDTEEDEEEDEWKLLPMQKVYADARVEHPVTGVHWYRLQGAAAAASSNNNGWATPGWVSATTTTTTTPQQQQQQQHTTTTATCQFQLLPASSLHTGLFAVRVLHTPLIVRDAPDCTDASHTALVLRPGQVVLADTVRASPANNSGNGPFLRLLDGSGWVFQHKLHEPRMERIPVREGRWMVTVLSETGIRSVQQPLPEYTALECRSYEFGTVIECDRCITNDTEGVSYYRVLNTDQKEWLYDKHLGQRMLSLLHEMGPSSISLPSWDLSFVRGILATIEGADATAEDEARAVVTVSLSDDDQQVSIFGTTRTLCICSTDHAQPLRRFQSDCSVEQLIATLHRSLDETIQYFDDLDTKQQQQQLAMDSTECTTSEDTTSMHSSEGGTNVILEIENSSDEEKKEEDCSGIEMIATEDSDERGLFAFGRSSSSSSAHGPSMLEETTDGPAAVETEEELRRQLLGYEQDISALSNKRFALIQQLKQYDAKRGEFAMQEGIKCKTQQQRHRDELALQQIQRELQLSPETKKSMQKTLLKTKKYKQVYNRPNELHVVTDPVETHSRSSTLSSVKEKPSSKSSHSGNHSVRSVRSRVYCGECHKKFSGKYSRDLHCRHVHKLFCEKCDKIFPSFWELEAHAAADNC